MGLWNQRVGQRMCSSCPSRSLISSNTILTHARKELMQIRHTRTSLDGLFSHNQLKTQHYAFIHQRPHEPPSQPTPSTHSTHTAMQVCGYSTTTLGPVKEPFVAGADRVRPPSRAAPDGTRPMSPLHQHHTHPRSRRTRCTTGADGNDDSTRSEPEGMVVLPVAALLKYYDAPSYVKIAQ